MIPEQALEKIYKVRYDAKQIVDSRSSTIQSSIPNIVRQDDVQALAKAIVDLCDVLTKGA